METPFNRPPVRAEPPPLLPFPPDTAGRPTTDEGVLGTRRVPAPSPGRPGLLRNNSMDFLGEAPDLSQGRRKVLNLSAKLQQTSRAPSHPTSTGSSSSAGRSLSYVPAHSSSFDSFLDGPPPPPAPAPFAQTSTRAAPSSSSAFGAALGMEIKVSPASPGKPPPGARASAGARAAALLASQPSGVPAALSSGSDNGAGAGGLEAGVELSVSAKPNRKGKTRSRAPPPPAPVLPPSALGRQCTTATSSPTSSTTRLSTTSLVGPPLLPFTIGPSPATADSAEAGGGVGAAAATGERRSVRPSTMMRRSSSARDVNPLVRAAASKSVASLNLARSSSIGGSNDNGGGGEGSHAGGAAAEDRPAALGSAPPTPPPEHGHDADELAPSGPSSSSPSTTTRVLAHTRIIKSKPRLTRSASAFGGLDAAGGSAYALSAPVSPKSRGAADFWLQGGEGGGGGDEVDPLDDGEQGGASSRLVLGPAIDAGIEVRAAEGDGPKVAVPCPKRTKRSPSPAAMGSRSEVDERGPTQLPSPPHPSPPLLHAQPQGHHRQQQQCDAGAPSRPRPERLSFGPGLSVVPSAGGGGLASPFEEVASGGPSANSSPPRPDGENAHVQQHAADADDDAIMSEPSGP